MFCSFPSRLESSAVLPFFFRCFRLALQYLLKPGPNPCCRMNIRSRRIFGSRDESRGTTWPGSNAQGFHQSPHPIANPQPGLICFHAASRATQMPVQRLLQHCSPVYLIPLSALSRRLPPPPPLQVEYDGHRCPCLSRSHEPNTCFWSPC